MEKLVKWKHLLNVKFGYIEILVKQKNWLNGKFG